MLQCVEVGEERGQGREAQSRRNRARRSVANAYRLRERHESNAEPRYRHRNTNAVQAHDSVVNGGLERLTVASIGGSFAETGLAILCTQG